ncbi:MAG: SH3 domain-containing protein [Nitrospinales bacterium]
MNPLNFLSHTKIYQAIFIPALLCVAITASKTEAICIKSDWANLRQGPGTTFEVMWKVYKYMPFKVLKKKGDWYRLQDTEGDIYWAHKKLLSSEFKCAVIKKDKTNLRTGPGTKFPMVKGSPAPKFYVMKVLKIENNWVHGIDSFGDKVWVYQPLVWVQ